MEKEDSSVYDNPLVTAVITTHNRFELVRSAIRSVQHQIYPHLELIVVDDASDPEIKEKLSYQAEQEGFQYLYIKKEDSKGGNHARNTGINHANGKYVAFLDDDDEWMPEKIDKQIVLLRQHPECRVCFCDRVIEFDDGKSRKYLDPTRLKEGDLSKDILMRILYLTSEMIVERDLLSEIGLFNENLQYWQEYELCIRLFQKTNVCVVRENLVLYRVNRSDPYRLTNRIDGWEDTVSYVFKKHASEFAQLSSEEIKTRDYYMVHEGITRAVSSGNKKEQRKYLWKFYKITKKPKDLAKAVLNVYSLRSHR